MSFDGIIANFKEIKFGSINWIELVHDQTQLWAIMIVESSIKYLGIL
jgi:hypothetical protein